MEVHTLQLTPFRLFTEILKTKDTFYSSREKPKHMGREGAIGGFCGTAETLWSTSTQYIKKQCLPV